MTYEITPDMKNYNIKYFTYNSMKPEFLIKKCKIIKHNSYSIFVELDSRNKIINNILDIEKIVKFDCKDKLFISSIRRRKNYKPLLRICTDKKIIPSNYDIKNAKIVLDYVWIKDDRIGLCWLLITYDKSTSCVIS